MAVTCPVCENVQERGEACDVCGLRLTGPGVAPEPIVPVEGLEPTLLAAVEAPVDRVEGLEPTLQEAVAAAGDGEPVPGLEATGAEAVEVAAETIPDLEPTAGEELPDPFAPPPGAPLLCRYCRTPAPQGAAFCGRCGMRIPRFDAVRMAFEVRGDLLCTDCGSMGPGPLCRRCGARMRVPER